MPRKPITPETKALRALIKAADQVENLIATETVQRLAALGDHDPAEVAQIIVSIHDQRARLNQAAEFLADTLGKKAGALQGNLPDGRQFTLKRSADRKEWQHEEWKRDARRAIVQEFTKPGDTIIEGVLTVTGEVIPLGPILQEAMTAIQNVHGSTAPKSTALKPLGLYASDYCTSTPGGWRLNAIRPESTLTEKDA